MLTPSRQESVSLFIHQCYWIYEDSNILTYFMADACRDFAGTDIQSTLEKRGANGKERLAEIRHRRGGKNIREGES